MRTLFLALLLLPCVGAQQLSAKLGMTIRNIIDKYVTIQRGGGLPEDWRYPAP